MPELIHTFTGGKMNKDLDERLVPNGEYRDALNLEIASSENSQVGAFQNVKGNKELDYKSSNLTTGVFTPWAAIDYITDLSNPICIGAKSDENSDEIYWFIASDAISVIASYNTITKLTIPLVVDTQNILKFSSDYLITGINVLEGMLLWTDNQTEPKKITIKDWVNSATDFLSHSTIYGRPFVESDLTVIKKYPLQPPTITAYSTAQNLPDGTPAVVDTQTLYSFAEVDPGGNVVAMTPETVPQQLEWLPGNIPPYYKKGNVLVFTRSDNDPLDADAVIKCEVLSIIGGNTTQIGAIVQVLSVEAGAETQTTDIFNYEVTLDQAPAFFEMRFARFGYRYKYNNNELSAYSPFSNPAFIPGEFDYSPKQGYNLGMVNNVRQLKISNFKPIDLPIDVKAIDILYKATNNSNVYVVDTFAPNDSEWENNTFNIETEIITSVVNANQLLRPYDNVPRKALAQEITANRLLFGNYTQNFDILTNTGDPLQTQLEIGLKRSSVGLGDLEANIDGNIVAESVKSIRTYQVGIAYMDIYGRTTPVFTSSGASVDATKEFAYQSTKITARLASAIPYYDQQNQFPYFKYYIKETSQEYYNLCLDRFYNAEDGNIWLSFPSAERNKVDEETFIILKKEHDNSTPVTEQARYKIIAIENEAPQYLKETKLSLGVLDTGFNGGGFPIEGAIEVWVDKLPFDEQFGEQSKTISSFVFRVTSAETVSSWYKVSSFSATGPSQEYIKIQSSSAFGSDMNFTSSFPYGIGFATSGLGIEIANVVSVNKPEFTGRFFVKVNQDNLLKQKIIEASNVISAKYTRKALGSLYWLAFDVNRKSEAFWDDWTALDAQNSDSRLFIDNIRADYVPQGNGLNTVGSMQVSWSGGYGFGQNAKKRSNGGIFDSNPGLLEQLNTNGSLFRFIDAGNGKKDPNSTVYRVTSTIERKYNTYDGNGTAGSRMNWRNQLTRWTIEFKVVDSYEALQWNPTNATDGIDAWVINQANYDNAYVGIEFIAVDLGDDSFTTTNPAIFETEPKEAAELDIYYEVPGAYLKSQQGDTHELDFFNCYSFGNGVESDRIRDDFNQPQIENGVKASATLDEPYNEEHRGTGIIFSQIFNSVSGVNGLNQFIQAESITKDVNPEYGSIQKLHSRDTDLVTLCENKSMRILANKDALFNADGSSNVTSNKAVLGQTVTFQGEFGIGTNPESFAEFGFRMYYTDTNRGTVIRLSNDGITEVSDYGMHAFFQDNLPLNSRVVGTWDVEKKNYNVTLSNLSPYWRQTLGAGQFDRLNKDPLCNQFVNTKPTATTTVSFKEDINGWTSRKTYIPEAGAYLNNVYYTFKSGRIWEHGANTAYNTFYNIGPQDPTLGTYYESSFNTIFNESPQSVKGFKAVNYSGTDSREYVYFVGASLQSYSLAQIQAQGLIPTSFTTKKGWYTNSIITDLQEGEVKEFINKEGKYFNYIKGLETFYNTNCDNNVNTNEFNVQGIGKATTITGPVANVYTVTTQLDDTCFDVIVPPS